MATQARAMLSTLGVMDHEASNPYLRDCRGSHLWPQPGDDEAAVGEARAILSKTEPDLPESDWYDVPLALLNLAWADGGRVEDVCAAIDSLRAFVAAEDPAAYLSGRQR